MTPDRFDHLLSLVKKELSPKQSRFRTPLGAAEKLLITLRYLATGDSQQSQAFNFRVGRSTVSKIVKQTCDVIWQKLSPDYLKCPSTTEEWKKISTDFFEDWNLPNVLGALDGTSEANYVTMLSLISTIVSADRQ